MLVKRCDQLSAKQVAGADSNYMLVSSSTLTVQHNLKQSH